MKEKDFPFQQVLNEANKLIESSDGVSVYQKFTCGKCKGRLTMEEANTFYTSGKCDKCGHVTDLRKTGCNYLVIARGGNNVFDPMG